MPIGVTQAKYTTTQTVSSGISLDVKVGETAYTYSLAEKTSISSAINNSGATSVQFVTGNNVPTGASFSAELSVASGSGRIGLFVYNGTAYIAPMSQTENKAATGSLNGNSVIYAPANAYCLMSGLSKVTSVTCTNLDTSKTSNMGLMFKNCSSLVTIHMESFTTTARPVYIEQMFYGDSSLVRVYVTKTQWTGDASCATGLNVFYNCTNIMGGTSYNTSLGYGYDMAKVSNGYFTAA